MRSFSKLYSDFWINYDNSEVISLGADAQLLALYLQGGSHHNIFGVYYLPLLYAASDLRVSVKKVQTALNKLCSADYCKYDVKTQYVWISKMASEQMGEKLEVNDNRIKAVQAVWDSLPDKLEFLEEIYTKYKDNFHLNSRSFSSSNSIKNSSRPDKNGGAAPTPIKDLQLPSEGLSKGELTPSEGSLKPFQGISEAPSEPLQSPFKGASDTLPVEYRIKNIENRSKKEEIDLEKIEKEKKEINLNSVLTPNIVAQARPYFEDQPKYFASSFLKTGSKFYRAKAEEVTDAANPALLLPLLPLSELKPTSRFETKTKPKETTMTKEITNPPQSSDGVTDSASVLVPVVTLPSVSTIQTISEKAPITTIFEHWKNTMNHPGAKLDSKRKKLISDALKMGYSVQELFEAITGCSHTPHNTGTNDQGQRYDGLQIILRNADQIDRFIRNYHHPPKPVTKAQHRQDANINEANEWLKSKEYRSTAVI